MLRALLAAGLLVVLLIGLRSSPAPASTPPPGRGDLGFHRAVTERLRAGEPYYTAAAAELRARRYPMRSIFNWRPPLLTRVTAALPDAVAAWMLITLTIASSVLIATAKIRQAPLAAALLVGTVLMPPLLHESWAGAFIGLSAVAYVRGWPIAGAVIGALALFVRELAAPYIIVCGLLALWHRRLDELGVWVLTALGYGAYFWHHAAQVSATVLPSDLAQSASWIQLGGLPFVVNALHITGWLVLLPRAAAAVALLLLTCVALSPRTPAILRGALVAYGVFFSTVGQIFNWYWGLLIGPVCAISLAYAPGALAGLFKPSERVGTAARGSAASAR